MAKQRKQVESPSFSRKIGDIRGPVDPLVTTRPPTPIRPQKSEGEEILDAISGLVDVGGDFFIQRQQRKAKEQQERGAIAAIEGQEAPDRASRAFFKGFDSVAGKKAVADLKVELEKLKSENLTASQFAQKRAQIEKSFLAGRSPEFLKSFFPGAEQALTNSDVEFQRKKTREARERLLRDASVAVRSQVEEFRRSVANGSMTPEEAAQAAVRFKDSLRDDTAPFVQQGLDKDAMSSLFVDAVISDALASRDTSLLEQIAEVPGKGGFRLSNLPEFRNSIINGVNMVKSLKRTEDAARSKAIKDELEKNSIKAAATLGQFLERARNVGGTEAVNAASTAVNLALEATKAGVMRPSEFKLVRTMAEKTRQEDEIDVPAELFNQDFTRVINGELTTDELTSLMNTRYADSSNQRMTLYRAHTQSRDDRTSELRRRINQVTSIKVGLLSNAGALQAARGLRGSDRTKALIAAAFGGEEAANIADFTTEFADAANALFTESGQTPTFRELSDLADEVLAKVTNKSPQTLASEQEEKAKLRSEIDTRISPFEGLESEDLFQALEEIIELRGD